MLTFYRRAGRGETPADLRTADLPPETAWIDLFRPDPDEVAFVERNTGLSVPAVGELSEIESSSRLRSEDGALYLSMPLVYGAFGDEPRSTPVGFVLTAERLITVRFEELRSFSHLPITTSPPKKAR
jgi:magnesium transporter